MHMLMCAKSLRSCPTLCDPMDCSPPGSSVHGIFQARTLEWFAMPCSRDGTIFSASLTSPALAGRFLVASTTREAHTDAHSGFKGSGISTPGNSRVVQWLGPHTSTAGGPGSILGQGTKIPHAHGAARNTTKHEFCIIPFSRGPRCRHSPQ